MASSAATWRPCAGWMRPCACTSAPASAACPAPWAPPATTAATPSTCSTCRSGLWPRLLKSRPFLPPDTLPMQLNEVRAVITGGVSGLGFAVAEHLVKHGGKVALFDVNEDKAAQAVAALGAGNAKFFRTDVSD